MVYGRLYTLVITGNWQTCLLLSRPSFLQTMLFLASTLGIYNWPSINELSKNLICKPGNGNGKCKEILGGS